MPNEYALPEARYFSLTWEIPSDFAGMTAAFLRRNRAFERLGDQVVDVLTFDAALHYPALEAGLRERGLLTPAARILNLWDWLRTHPEPPQPGFTAPDSFAPLEPLAEYETASRDGAVLTRARRDAAGEIAQIDYYRGDGTLLASDRRDIRRSIVLCDAWGRPARSWSSAGAFYCDWVDHVRAGERSVMIVDSKTVARFMLAYRRRDVTTVHVLHGSHRGEGGEGVRASRSEVIERLDAFDLVVTLTESQRRDLLTMPKPARNVVAIPNSVDLPAERRDTRRDRGGIAVLASLIPRKRVSHAIKAVAAVHEATPHPVSLTVYGDGPQRPKLESLIGRLGAGGFVTLAGHVPDAEQALATSSMLLLTSHSEGFGLVLIEAMANGCLPIAYDVPYGPADVIEDGVNGFLVPAADVEALAAKIRLVLDLGDDELKRMRESARRRAAEFSDEAVVRGWAAALGRREGAASRLGRFVHRLERRLRRG